MPDACFQLLLNVPCWRVSCYKKPARYTRQRLYDMMMQDSS